ncbi:hypothetical protein H2O64_06340 [Kordia sp. YSTF-M3]|uniref:Permease n=1 Tax=Kordia aestuariivivens TaxID=2759037 RepID=A0ABR7Q769_9FLAO|nr:hypothetical protein [Kordia aestuariivivens]MBC8754283.1 hypothetical protein [Kordia aestuariivivens]
MSILFFAPILLIGLGYYLDYKDNPARFMSDIKGGMLYFLGLLAFVMIQKIVFGVGLLFLVLQVAIFILASFFIKFLIEKGK